MHHTTWQEQRWPGNPAGRRVRLDAMWADFAKAERRARHRALKMRTVRLGTFVVLAGFCLAVWDAVLLGVAAAVR